MLFLYFHCFVFIVINFVFTIIDFVFNSVKVLLIYFDSIGNNGMQTSKLNFLSP
jgi:hypothetical protein